MSPSQASAPHSGEFSAGPEVRVAVFRCALRERVEPYIARQLVQMADASLFTIDNVYEPQSGQRAVATRVLLAYRVIAFKLLRRSKGLERALREFAPDVVLAHFAPDAWRLARIVGRLRRPLVVVCHGSDVLLRDEHLDLLGYSGRQLRRHWTDLFEAAALFLPVSDHVAEALQARGCPSEKIHRHYLGVDIPSKIPKRTPGSRLQILFVGRLERNKGCDALIRALSLLIQAGIPSDLTIVGAGSQKARLEQLVKELSLDLYVTFTGPVPGVTLARLYGEADLLCACSQTESDGVSEGFGLVAVEAQAYGLPVVVTDVGGLPETVLSGESGFVVPPRDPVALAATLGRFAADPALRDRMGREARSWSAQRFDGKARTRELDRILAEVARNGQ